jgi:hypothetical protein
VSDPHAPAPQVWDAPQPRRPRSLGEKVGLGCLGVFVAFGILVALGLMLSEPGPAGTTTATEETPTPTGSVLGGADNGVCQYPRPNAGPAREVPWRRERQDTALKRCHWRGLERTPARKCRFT